MMVAAITVKQAGLDDAVFTERFGIQHDVADVVLLAELLHCPVEFQG